MRSPPASRGRTRRSCGCRARATTTTWACSASARSRRRKRRGAIGLYHLAWQVDTIEELAAGPAAPSSRLGAYTGESSHGATKSIYGAGPRRQRVRGHVDAPARGWGEYENAAPDRARSTCAARCPLDRRPHRRPSSCPRTASMSAAHRAASTPPVVAFARRRTTPRRRWSSCCTAAARTSSEILALAPHLPAGATYAAVRAPDRRGRRLRLVRQPRHRPPRRGVAGRDDGVVPRAGSTRSRPAGRPVVLVGFSGGAAFAGGLVLADPARYRRCGDPLRHAALRRRACRSTPRRLARLPVFVAQGEADTVIPRELLDRTWCYLLDDSGAPAWRLATRAGTASPPAALRRARRLARSAAASPRHARRHPSARRADVAGRPLPGGRSPHRRGPRPAVSWRIPQQQLSDTAPAELQEQLFARVAALAGVSAARRAISVPGARGLVLGRPGGPGRGLPRAGRSASSPTCTRPTTARCTSRCRRRQAADVVAKGWGVAAPAGRASASRPGFVDGLRTARRRRARGRGRHRRGEPPVRHGNLRTVPR